MNKLRAATAILLLFPALLRAQQALLWVPAQDLPPDDVLAVLQARPDLRLTAAFPGLSKDAGDRVRALEKAGALETALRLPGDPPLPLLYAPASPAVRWANKPSTAALTDDPYFLGLRLTQARDEAAAAKRPLPAGFANPPGGLAEAYFPLARAIGLKWIACGPLASTAAAVAQADGVYAVPFAAAVPVSSPTAVSTAAPAAAPAFVVYDETSAADPAALRALLKAALEAAPAGSLATVSEALRTAVSTAMAPAELAAQASPWTGDYTAWAAAPAQAGALAALAKTRADLMLYLNSKQGSYKAAAPAFDEYYQAEDGARLRALAPAGSEAASAAEMETLTSIANAYRLMQKAPPPWVFSGLGDAAAQADEADSLAVAVKDGGFTVTNVPRKPEVPAGAELPKDADPDKVWKLASFGVAPAPDAVTFTFTPGALDNSDNSPSGFSHIRLDLYIDINHRPRAGMYRPLPGRPLRLFPENAWEYALEVSPEKAVLYKITPKGPAQAGTYQPKAENGAVTVRVPRSALRGSPLLWGYAALLLAPDAKDPKAFSIADYIADDISNGYIYAVRPGGN